MNYYPIILIPNEFKRIRNSFPPLPKKPSEPPKPIKGENETLGCFTLIAVAIIIFLLIIIGLKDEIIPVLMIASIIIFIIHFSKKDKINNQFYNDKIKYEYSLNEYERSLKIWEYEKMKILNNSEKIKVYRNNAFKAFLYQTQKANQIFKSQKGYSENKFQKYLIQYFGNNISTNKAIIEPYFKKPYQPDFIFNCAISNLHIDIEIDEPYVLSSGEPIHYESFGVSIDNNRNKYFTNKGWIVIRFTEEQVLFYPKECCKIIAEVIIENTNNQSIFGEFSKIRPLKKIKQWTKEEAIALFKKNVRLKMIAEIELKGNIAKQKKNSIKIFNQGVKLYKEKNYLQSVQLFTESINLDETHFNSFYYRAISLRLLNKPNEALKDLAVLVNINVNDHKSINQVGNCYSLMGKYEKAIFNYSRAINLCKKSSYLKNRANCYKKISEYEKALEDYSDYLLIHPKDYQIFNARGIIFKELKKNDLAIKDFTMAIEFSSVKVKYLNNRGICYLLDKSIDKASEDFNNVIDLNYEDIISNYYLDFIESTFFGSNLNLISIEKNGKKLTTFTNSFKNFDMALFDFLKKNPLLEKWNQMNEYWKMHFRTEIGFRGTPKDNLLNEIFGTKSLELNMKGLKDLSIVNLLPYLEELVVSWNPISDLTPLKSCLKLELLVLSGTNVTDLTPLRNLTNLRELYLNQTPVNDISPLSQLVNLECLFLSKTRITSLTSLGNLKNLQSLNIENTDVSDLSPLYDLKKLKKLWGDYILLEPDMALIKGEEIMSFLPNLKLMHNEQTQAPVNVYMDKEGNVDIDEEQLNNAVNDPEAYNREYQEYLQLMKDVQNGIVSQELMNSDPNKRGLSLKELKLIMKFSG